MINDNPNDGISIINIIPSINNFFDRFINKKEQETRVKRQVTLTTTLQSL